MKTWVLSTFLVSAAVAAAAVVPSVVQDPQPLPAGGLALVAAQSPGGSPDISDNKSGQPIFPLAASGLAAGSSVTGTVTIANAGSAPLWVSVQQQNLTTGPANRPNLALYVQLTVTDTTLLQQVYKGSMAGFFSQPSLLCGTQPTRQVPCPKWAKGESHNFTFTVSMPNAAPGAAVQINSYQATYATTDYVWSASPS